MAKYANVNVPSKDKFIALPSKTVISKPHYRNKIRDVSFLSDTGNIKSKRFSNSKIKTIENEYINSFDAPSQWNKSVNLQELKKDNFVNTYDLMQINKNNFTDLSTNERTGYAETDFENYPMFVK